VSSLPTTTLRPIETPEQAIRRLAAKARACDVRVYRYPGTGEFYANSYSQPDILHRVTRFSCDCPGFIRHGRCMHHAALVHHLGELPPEPTPPASRLRDSRPAPRLEVSA
jgi:hypothetical protein